MKKPLVITMGEPSGIASEIAIKSWIQRKKLKLPAFFLLDDFNKIEFINKKFNLNANLKKIETPKQVSKLFSKYLPILDMKVNLKFKLGKPDSANSQFVLKSINDSYDLIKKKEVSGMVTLPVCKKSLKKNGFKFCGQTEYLAHLSSKGKNSINKEIMILSTSKPADRGANLIVGLVTTHLPLKECLNKITKKILEEKISVFNDSLKKLWKISKPRIAIAAINPHAGEGGLIGQEEMSLIKPVIEKISRKIRVRGPFSGDSCFAKHVRANFDGIICFYHDQGLIPVKLLDFYNSINVTGGLPFIRVSPDHGPAFDIAKNNEASPNSLCSAINFLKRNV